jgi:signal transduction histidine kinase
MVQLATNHRFKLSVIGGGGHVCALKACAAVRALLRPKQIRGIGACHRLASCAKPADHLPALRCDPGDLENVLLNLAINAREAMPGGGRLLIEASADRIAHSLAGTVTISVSDTGCGMPAEIAARAFERSFSTKSGSGPRGLGLAAVRQFARDLGGNATLQSKVGGGTCIRLRLPAEDPANGASPG